MDNCDKTTADNCDKTTAADADVRKLRHTNETLDRIDDLVNSLCSRMTATYTRVTVFGTRKLTLGPAGLNKELCELKSRLRYVVGDALYNFECVFGESAQAATKVAQKKKAAVSAKKKPTAKKKPAAKKKTTAQTVGESDKKTAKKKSAGKRVTRKTRKG